MKVIIIFALIACIAAFNPRLNYTSQFTDQDLGDDPGDLRYAEKLLQRLLPARSDPPVSLRMVIWLAAVAFPGAPHNYSRTDNYQTHLDESLKCQKKIGLTNTTTCDKLKTVLKDCLKPLIEKTIAQGRTPPENVQQILDLRQDAALATIEFVCESKPEKLSELQHDCLHDVRGREIHAKLRENVDVLKFKSAPTAASMCDMIIGVRSLLEDQLKAHCSNNDAAVKASMDYFDAPLKPCVVRNRKT